MRIKMEDVAKAVGVSKATVSLVMNDSPLVNAQTRIRVKQAAKKLGYEPNSQARRLALKRSGQIGLIVPDVENVYYASLMRYMNIEIQRAGYSMLSAISENLPETEEKLVRELLRNSIDAIILVPVHNSGIAPPSIYRILQSKTPAVLATSTYMEAGISCVMCDLYTGMRELATLLYQRGRRKQVFISSDSAAVAFSLREKGFFDALMGKDAQANKVYLRDITYEEAFRWARNDSLTNIDAILCVNDMMALGVLEALKQRGISVPEDIAVTGFDDVIFSRITSTPITTVRQNLALLSKLTVEHAVKLIQDSATTEDIMIPCQLIERAST